MDVGSYQLTVEARAQLQAIADLLAQIPDGPMQFLEPYPLLVLLDTVIEKLDKVLDPTQAAA